MRLQQKAKSTDFVFSGKAHGAVPGLATLIFRPHTLPPSLIALIAQAAAAAITLFLLAPAFGLLGITLALVPAAFVQGGIAAALGFRLRLAPWWLPIHLLFMPAVVCALSFGFAPAWFLSAFLLLFMVYWSAFSSQVPLYLSSRKAWSALADMLPGKQGFAMLDLGCGLGGMLAYLSAKRPDGRFHGMEIAPLPFALARLRKMAGRGTYQVRWGDFWTRSLAAYDIVYAYLSPVPMERLWVKACSEMAAGSRFVSNTFAVPGIQPEAIVELDDFHCSRLYVYCIPARQRMEREASS